MNIIQILHEFLSKRCFRNGRYSLITRNVARGNAYIICLVRPILQNTAHEQ